LKKILLEPHGIHRVNESRHVKMKETEAHDFPSAKPDKTTQPQNIFLSENLLFLRFDRFECQATKIDCILTNCVSNALHLPHLGLMLCVMKSSPIKHLQRFTSSVSLFLKKGS